MEKEIALSGPDFLIFQEPNRTLFLKEFHILPLIFNKLPTICSNEDLKKKIKISLEAFQERAFISPDQNAWERFIQAAQALLESKFIINYGSAKEYSHLFGALYIPNTAEPGYISFSLSKPCRKYFFRIRDMFLELYIEETYQFHGLPGASLYRYLRNHLPHTLNKSMTYMLKLSQLQEIFQMEGEASAICETLKAACDQINSSDHTIFYIKPQFINKQPPFLEIIPRPDKEMMKEQYEAFKKELY